MESRAGKYKKTPLAKVHAMKREAFGQYFVYKDL